MREPGAIATTVDALSCFLRLDFPLVANRSHGLGKVALCSSVIALGHSYEDGVEYVKLSDTGGPRSRREAARRATSRQYFESFKTGS